MVLLLHDRHGVEVSVRREAVRRGPHRGHLVHRRPRPTPKPDAPPRQAKLVELRALLEGLPDDEAAVRQDEVEVHTNPKIGRMWWEGRIEVHLLPSYCPDLNPIERVWWHLHENITRNHRCKDLGEFLDQVFAWLGRESPFQIEGSVYPKAEAA